MRNDNEEWRVYDNSWADRAKGVIFIVILMILLLIGMSYCSNARAQEAPENFKSITVPFVVHCSNPTSMRDALLQEHGEIALIAGFLDTGVRVLWYGSESGKSMSIVIHKSDQEACLIWSGISADGNATVHNPEPTWPERGEAPELKGEEWNL